MSDKKSPLFLSDSAWERFKAILNSWIGTPYRHLAMVKGRGADCTLFIGACWKEFGILTQVSYDYYPRDWYVHSKDELVLDSLFAHFSKYAAACYSIGRFPPSEALLRGDILTFSTNKNLTTNHAAVFMDDNERILHALPRRGVSLTPMRGFLSGKITNVFRVFCDGN